MAIFVTGDVHGGAEYGSSRFSSKSWPDGRTLSRDDVDRIMRGERLDKPTVAELLATEAAKPAKPAPPPPPAGKPSDDGLGGVLPTPA